jgi:hypothetical protein
MICVLCNREVGSKFSREHVFPDWMRKYFTGDDDRVPYKRGSQQREEAYTLEEWEDRAFNWRV